MHAFVTVGSTRFDALVKHALSDVVIDVLRTKGYSDIVVQCGNSDFDRSVYTLEGDTWTRNLEGEGSIEVWKFKPTLQQEYERADLVISHAGMSQSNSSHLLSMLNGVVVCRVGHHSRCLTAKETYYCRAKSHST